MGKLSAIGAKPLVRLFRCYQCNHIAWDSPLGRLSWRVFARFEALGLLGRHLSAAPYARWPLAEAIGDGLIASRGIATPACVIRNPNNILRVSWRRQINSCRCIWFNSYGLRGRHFDRRQKGSTRVRDTPFAWLSKYIPAGENVEVRRSSRRESLHTL